MTLLDEIKARLKDGKNPEQCHLIEARLMLCADMDWLIERLEIAQQALEFYAKQEKEWYLARKALEEMK